LLEAHHILHVSGARVKTLQQPVTLYAVDIPELRKSTDGNDRRGNVLAYSSHSPGRLQKLTGNQSWGRNGAAYVLDNKTNRDIYPWINFVLYDTLALNKLSLIIRCLTVVC